MTTQELKDLFANIAAFQQETAQEIKELTCSQKITSQEIKELFAKTSLSQQETAQEIKELTCSQKITSQEIKELFAKTSLSQDRVDQQIKETDQQIKETDRQLRKQMKELGKQIGGLGNKFGSFTEGMAFPSLEKTLRNRFGMENISFRNKRQKEDELLELDILAYSNGIKNEAFVVEIKSHLLEREFAQILKTMQQFVEFFPEHHDKTLYGMVAVVDTTKELKQKILDEGLYLALIHDDQFTLKTPKNFKPKAFFQPSQK